MWKAGRGRIETVVRPGPMGPGRECLPARAGGAWSGTVARPGTGGGSLTAKGLAWAGTGPGPFPALNYTESKILTPIIHTI